MLNIRHLEKLLKNNGKKTILYDKTSTYTGQDLLQKAAGLATFFASKNVQEGDRVAVQLPNCIEFIFCYFAGIIGGYTIVPINSALPQRDIDYILSVTKPKLQIQKIEDLEFETFNNDLKIRSSQDTIIAIFFTSGTTSRPKGVCHTTDNMFANAIAFNELVGIDENIRMMHIMPMGYMAGFLNTILCPILAGGSVIIAPQFNAKEAINFWKPAQDYNVNAVWITPTMAALLARLNRNELITAWTREHLRHVFIGTAPLPVATKSLFESTFGVDCLESYGMTEIMLVSSNTEKYIKKHKSVGRLLKTIELKTKNEKGFTLDKEKEGDLFIKSPYALKGYLDPETSEIYSPLQDGWLATGDSGYVDEDNNLFITGRIKDLIIHGGTNVSPRAVEEVLLQHADIQEAAVIGSPHAFWGEEVVAFLTLVPNKIFNQADVKAHCQKYLHPDAVPSLFKIIHEFPRASTGKIQVHKLRELA